MTDSEYENKRKEFLMTYIFAPLEVWLPEDYEQILLSLNVWPATTLEPQRKALMSRKSFDIRGTTIHTKAPELKFKMRDGSFVSK